MRPPGTSNSWECENLEKVPVPVISGKYKRQSAEIFQEHGISRFLRLGSSLVCMKLLKACVLGARAAKARNCEHFQHFIRWIVSARSRVLYVFVSLWSSTSDGQKNTHCRSHRVYFPVRHERNAAPCHAWTLFTAIVSEKRLTAARSLHINVF